MVSFLGSMNVRVGGKQNLATKQKCCNHYETNKAKSLTKSSYLCYLDTVFSLNNPTTHEIVFDCVGSDSILPFDVTLISTLLQTLASVSVCTANIFSRTTCFLFVVNVENAYKQRYSFCFATAYEISSTFYIRGHEFDVYLNQTLSDFVFLTFTIIPLFFLFSLKLT